MKKMLHSPEGCWLVTNLPSIHNRLVIFVNPNETSYVALTD